MLGNEEINRLRNKDLKNLLCRKKLYLVLDLDQTLIDSTRLKDLTSEEEHLKGYVDSLHDTSNGSLFILNSLQRTVKLRPFLRTFLKEASQMFEMYIYTMATRPHALDILKLLDPQNEYFSSRIISRKDGTGKGLKGLDVVLCSESAVLIVDDNIYVWKKHLDNLIHVQRYLFFTSSCRGFGSKDKSLAVQHRDELECEGALGSLLEAESTPETLNSRDVRQVLEAVRKDVLKGCKVVFASSFRRLCKTEDHLYARAVDRLGGVRSSELDESVTHVVAGLVSEKEAQWAVKNKKFLVVREWLLFSNALLRRVPEHHFALTC